MQISVEHTGTATKSSLRYLVEWSLLPAWWLQQHRRVIPQPRSGCTSFTQNRLMCRLLRKCAVTIPVSALELLTPTGRWEVGSCYPCCYLCSQIGFMLCKKLRNSIIETHNNPCQDALDRPEVREILRGLVHCVQSRLGTWHILGDYHRVGHPVTSLTSIKAVLEFWKAPASGSDHK